MGVSVGRTVVRDGSKLLIHVRREAVKLILFRLPDMATWIESIWSAFRIATSLIRTRVPYLRTSRVNHDDLVEVDGVLTERD
jgi:hypothetical protein